MWEIRIREGFKDLFKTLRYHLLQTGLSATWGNKQAFEDLKRNSAFFKATKYYERDSFTRALAKTEIIYPKNVGAHVAIDFT